MKKLFLSATGPNKGKTSISVGMFSLLKELYGKVGYMKPIGQRYVEKDGLKIDEDVELLDSIYHFNNSLKDMSPIIIDKNMTREKILEGPNSNLMDKVLQAYQRIKKDKEMVLIEGAGKCSVGETFSLSNIKIAKALDAPVILIAEGGIGSTIDECALNLAYLEKYDIDILGVIINKVYKSKYDDIVKYTTRGLNRIGIDVLGIIRYESVLTYPTFDTLCEELDVELLTCKEGECLETNISKILIGAMKPHQFLNYLKGGELLITGGDREDILISVLFWSSMAIKQSQNPIAGVIVTGGISPSQSIVDMAKKLGIIILLAPEDTYTIASQIKDQVIKTKPCNINKINCLKQLVKDNIKIEEILNLL